jgi:hypothetical protein
VSRYIVRRMPVASVDFHREPAAFWPVTASVQAENLREAACLEAAAGENPTLQNATRDWATFVSATHGYHVARVR